MTPDWGGRELSNEKQGFEHILIKHVKIFKRD
ncbi:MAG: Imm32 family immunity protein [bacterium]